MVYFSYVIVLTLLVVIVGFSKQTKELVQLTISIAGDVTIGSDLDYGMTRSFIEEVNKQKNLNYFVENVKDIFFSQMI